jgi:hypothetical protein
LTSISSQAIQQAVSRRNVSFRPHPPAPIKLDMWYKKTQFKTRVHRKQELIRFVNYYNTVKPHKGINNIAPMEKLINYFYPKEL